MARVSIDDDFMKQLQELLKTDSASKVTEDALTLLNWAAKEVKSGRTILSAGADGQNVHKLAMPSLAKIGAA